MSQITVSTLVDTCNFPSIRFGRYYTGRLPKDTISGDTITHPGPETVKTGDVFVGSEYEETSTGATVTNLLKEGLPSVTAVEDVSRRTASGTRTIENSSFTVTPQYATTIVDNVVTSDFGGIASDVNVTRPTVNPHVGPVVVQGKTCGPT